MRRLLVCALLASAGYSDDIILKSGTVIQGKVDQKASNEKNKGKTLKRDMVLVIKDEKGAAKEIPLEQVKYVALKQTPWEERAENLKRYEKQKQGAKDTIADQERLAQWCRRNRLDPEAQSHYQRAYALMKAELKDEVDSHLSLAEWARKMGLLKESEEQITAAYALKRKQVDDATPEGFIQLARWLESKDMSDLAEKQYEEALKIDPKSAAARSALAQIRSRVEYKTRALVAAYTRAQRSYALTVAIEDNADKKVLDEWAKRVQELSNYVFVLTEGQFFISSCVIEDMTSNGRILVERGKLNDKHLDPASGIAAYCTQPGMPEWQVHAAGRPEVGTLCHEMFHGVFGLPDEYYGTPQCPCVMAAEGSPDALCDDGNHRAEAGGGGAPDSCWHIVLGLHKDVRHPNPEYKSVGKLKGELSVGGIKLREPPPVKIQIIDN